MVGCGVLLHLAVDRPLIAAVSRLPSLKSTTKAWWVERFVNGIGWFGAFTLSLSKHHSRPPPLTAAKDEAIV